jgi:hypothetical protein
MNKKRLFDWEAEERGIRRDLLKRHSTREVARD